MSNNTKKEMKKEIRINSLEIANDLKRIKDGEYIALANSYLVSFVDTWMDKEDIRFVKFNVLKGEIPYFAFGANNVIVISEEEYLSSSNTELVFERGKILSLKDAKEVSLIDYTSYDPERCHDGGCYSFWTDYIPVGNGRFKIVYGTSADFEYCPCCGRFDDHSDYNEEYGYSSGYICGEFGSISEKKLIKQINSFEESEDMFYHIQRL